jgi:TetR/AcrR family transcriptional repressor of nem operon
MSRALKIPREEALKAAMTLFWARGYSATTLDDIQEAIGLQRGSIYAHFKSKENLFHEALDLYQTEIVAKRRARVREAASAKEGIKLFFSILIDHSLENRTHPGCLNTNTASELSVIDEKIGNRALAGLHSWEEFWFEILERSKLEADIPKEAKLRSLARLLVALTQGINLVSKVNPDKKYLRETVEAGLSFFVEER